MGSVTYVRGGLKIPMACADCGEMFLRDNGPQKRCNTCRSRVCPHCGKSFISPSNHAVQRYCSLSCSAADDVKTLAILHANRGRRPRTYHLRHRDKHGGAADVEWRNAVFERDDYTCQGCGVRGGRLQAHHIKPYKEFPELRHDLANGQTLCVECHKKTDTYGWSKYWHGKRKSTARRLQQSVMQFDEPATRANRLTEVA